jgi:glycosyltransferase involved in cell wall biosynthesis
MIVSTFYPAVGGTQHQAQRLSGALASRGWSVHVLTRRHSRAFQGDLPQHELVAGVPVTRVYSRGASRAGALLFVLGGLWYLLRSGRRGIYHAHDLGAAGWLAVAARYLLRGQCIVKLRTGSQFYRTCLSSRRTRWRLLTLLRLADRIVVVNSEVETMLRDLRFPSDRVVRVPNGVDTGQFLPASAAEKREARHRLGLPGHKAVFLYVGRLDVFKGVDTLVRAWALLPDGTYLQAHLVVVGDGPRRQELHEMLSSFGIDDSVSMVGMQPAVHDYYSAADIFVLPSDTEGLSNALLEAMACGLPCIASRVGGALDVIAEGENGTLFDAGDAAQLAARIRDMLNRRDEWLAMGWHSRQTVEAYASFDAVIGRYGDLCGQLLVTNGQEG